MDLFEKKAGRSGGSQGNRMNPSSVHLSDLSLRSDAFQPAPGRVTVHGTDAAVVLSGIAF